MITLPVLSSSSSPSDDWAAMGMDPGDARPRLVVVLKSNRNMLSKNFAVILHRNWNGEEAAFENPYPLEAGLCASKIEV